MKNTERLEQSATLLSERSKSSPHSAELQALNHHQAVLESLVSAPAEGGKAALKAAKAPKSAPKHSSVSKSAKTSPNTPAAAPTAPAA